jgi:hypothetical protein
VLDQSCQVKFLCEWELERNRSKDEEYLGVHFSTTPRKSQEVSTDEGQPKDGTRRAVN